MHYQPDWDAADQAAYHADMTALEQDAERVIEKATHEPISQDEAALLRWAAGLGH